MVSGDPNLMAKVDEWVKRKEGEGWTSYGRTSSTTMKAGKNI